MFPFAFSLVLPFGLAACGEDDVGSSSGSSPGSTSSGSSGIGGGANGPIVEVSNPAAPPLPGFTECEVVKTTRIPVADGPQHVSCTDVAYATNPPSGGDHDNRWAAWKAYTSPVRREHYVHNLEHGGIVLAYDCAGPCADVVAALEKAMAETPADPLCTKLGPEPRARLLLTPDPRLDTPIALAAWGATYTATCVDAASLRAFIDEAYGAGPEATCSNGIDVVASPVCP